jgi:hypothetical protein
MDQRDRERALNEKPLGQDACDGSDNADATESRDPQREYLPPRS